MLWKDPVLSVDRAIGRPIINASCTFDVNNVMITYGSASVSK